MPKKTATKPALKTIKFSLDAPGAKKVYLVGEFNQWNPTEIPLQTSKNNGTWTTSVKLQPGRYKYKFVVDDEWWTDPNCPTWEWNEHGSQNSILEV